MSKQATFRQVAIVTRPESDEAETIRREIAAMLERRGIRAVAVVRDFREESASKGAQAPRYDLGIAVGGDGTLLMAAHLLARRGVPLIGVNTGRLGFLADCSPRDIAGHLDAILDGQYLEEQRLLAEYRLRREGETLLEGIAVNEVAVQKRDISRLFVCETRIDGRFLGRQRGDGLIVATPTGSTAYALASGGPILFPSLDVLALVPVCPHTLGSRPLAIGSQQEIEVRIDPGGKHRAGLMRDGQLVRELRPGDNVQIRGSGLRLRLIHPLNYDYFDILRSKLKWGRAPC